MYVKYIDENNVETAPNPIYGEDKVYANPTHETLVAHGYFPLIETPMPVKEGYYYTYHYELDEETVVKVWDEHEVPPEPEPVVEEESPVENVQDSEVEPEPEETQEQENEPDLVEENEPEVEPETEEVENEFA